MAEYNSAYTGPQIDDAVAKRHEHSDLPALNKVGEDISGNPTWDNDQWPIVPLSRGVSVLPTITYTSPNITVSGGEYCIYNTIDFSGRLFHVGSVPQATFEITDEGIVYYLYALNTNGVGSFGITTNSNLLLDGRYVAIARIIRTGAFFHTFLYDTLCLGYNSKLQTVMEQVFGFQKMSGLGIAVAGTRNLVVDAGKVAYGAIINNVASINTTAGDNLIFVYKDGDGQWQTSSITQLNNTQYQTPTGLASLTSINQAVNWVWRGIEEQKHIYVLLGEGNYNETQALESSPPTPPTWVTDHSILVGRVLFVRNSNTPSYVQNIESVGYGVAGAFAHDDTSNKSGIGPEYYHLSNDQYDGLTAGTNTTLHRHANATTEVDGYLSAADKIKIDNLGNASSLDVGTTAGTVAAGDDGRFGKVLTKATAGVNLGGHRAVVITTGAAVYADNTDTTHMHKVIGITTGATAIGDITTIQSAGEMTELSWSWTLNAPIFLGVDGLLTQTPPSTGFSQIIAFPVSTTSIFVNLREPIVLN